MLKKRIIPAIDVANQQAVKYIQFRNPKVIGDPAELGQKYAEQGADELFYLDTTASLYDHDVKFEWIRRVAEKVYIPFSVIGGIRTIEDIRQVLRAGADKVGINTAAVIRPELITEAAAIYGKQCIVLGLDAKAIRNSNEEVEKWEVYTHAAHKDTGLDAIEWAKQAEQLGAGEIVCTSIERDGMRNGYDLELMQELVNAVNIPIVASGGAGRLAHIEQVLAADLADAALVASLLHFKEYTIFDIKNYLEEHQVPVRKKYIR